MLPEPDLEFAYGARHPDPRAGIAAFGPLDLGHDTRPDRIRIGLVGPRRHTDEARSWLTSTTEPIVSKPPRRMAQTSLFPGFPGFNEDHSFRSTLIMDDRAHRTVSSAVTPSGAVTDSAAVTRQLVDAYMDEIVWLTANTNVDVIVCTRPEFTVIDGSNFADGEHRRKPDFHDQLKMAALRTGVPLQVMRPETWESRTSPPQGFERRRVQDPATRAWNLFTALYYKAGGRPWRLRRTFSDTATCYLGISFYRPAYGPNLNSSVAHLFNERGEGVVVHGGPAAVTKDDPRPFLTEEQTVNLVTKTLAAFRDEHGHAPARLVVHKTSRFRESEQVGFHAAAAEERIGSLDLLWFAEDVPRLYRLGELPPQRGTMLSLTDNRLMLYTQGTIPFYGTYPGMHVPTPLSIRVAASEHSPAETAEETLSLTKLNWNQSRLDNRLPITLLASQKVRAILAHGEPEDVAARPYRNFM